MLFRCTSTTRSQTSSLKVANRSLVRDTGVVYQYVDLAEPFDGRLDERLNLKTVGAVGGQ